MAAHHTAYRIQFQKGLGLREFQRLYGTEEQCRFALERMRWPEGFNCPACASRKGWRLARPLIRCRDCRKDTSLTAGTLFHATKLPLNTWFLAVYLFTQTKTGLSTIEMKRHLGVNEKTAWLIQHKLMECMRCAESGRRLSGTVEMLEQRFQGGSGTRFRKGKKATGPHFLIAGQISANGGITHACIDPVPTLRAGVLRTWAQFRLTPGTRVVTTQSCGFKGIEQADHVLERACNPSGLAGTAEKGSWSRILASNLRTTLSGVRHDKVEKYHGRYMGLFQFRLNHRFDLRAICGRTLEVSALSPPRPRRVLESVEISGKSGRGQFPTTPSGPARPRQGERRPILKPGTPHHQP